VEAFGVAETVHNDIDFFGAQLGFDAFEGAFEREPEVDFL
jgi:hypothetical protein